MSEYRNSVLVGDTISVTASVSGTPLSFDTRVLKINRQERRPLYVCSLPDELIYGQNRGHFRLVLGMVSRAEATMSINDKKQRGPIIDISEAGVCCRLPAATPIKRRDVIEGVRLKLSTSTTLTQEVEILNIHPVVHSPNTIQIGARFNAISPEDVSMLRDHIKESERRRLHNIKNSQDSE